MLVQRILWILAAFGAIFAGAYGIAASFFVVFSESKLISVSQKPTPIEYRQIAFRSRANRPETISVFQLDGRQVAAIGAVPSQPFYLLRDKSLDQRLGERLKHD